MVIVYQLRKDKQRMEAVQKATLTSRKFGIMRTHGLFGSQEWWQKIESGKLAVHRLGGVITQLYMGGMRDTPEFTMRSDAGEESSWLRYANGKELDDFYTVGCRIEIDYVLQRHRLLSDLSCLKKHKEVIEIRLGNHPKESSITAKSPVNHLPQQS
jgi:hypothetical protein